MTFHPTGVALLLTSGLSAGVLVWAAPFAVDVLRRFDLSKSDPAQLAREQKTYLVSTFVALVLLLRLVALFLLVFSADRLATQLTGAMCAVGTFHATPWGQPALALAVEGFFAAALWLATDVVDRRGFDYPLVRFKYALLLVMAPIEVASTAVLALFLRGVEPNVITSCCSTLFGDESASGAAREVALLPPALALALFGGALALTLASGAWVRAKAKGAPLFAGSALATFVLAIVAVISALSPYVYESPEHHCPFCLLKGEYGYVGWALYVPLFAATALALAALVAELGSSFDSLARVGPRLERGFASASLAAFALVFVVCAVIVVRSPLALFEGDFVSALARALSPSGGAS